VFDNFAAHVKVADRVVGIGEYHPQVMLISPRRSLGYGRSRGWVPLRRC
jgi:hypothetical protein